MSANALNSLNKRRGRDLSPRLPVRQELTKRGSSDFFPQFMNHVKSLENQVTPLKSVALKKLKFASFTYCVVIVE